METGLFLSISDEDSGVSRDAFLTACEAKLFCGGGLDGNIIHIDAHNFGQTLLHLRDASFQFRTLGTDGGIDVAYSIAFRGNEFHRLAQKDFAVYAVVLLTVIREMKTDVTHSSSPKQGIADGMNQHIGIAMPKQSQWVLEAYTTKPQLASLYKLMDIITKTNTNFQNEELRVKNEEFATALSE